MIWCRFHPASSCLLTLFCFFGTAIQAGAQLSSTEQRFLDLVEPIAQAPTEDFRLLPLVKMSGVGAGYRYQIAFLSYGVVSLAQSDPDRTPHYRRLFLRLLDKMEHPTTQSFWKKSGYRGDGKSRDNIMYRGHLALMYALTHFSFGSTRDSEKFHKLVNSLHREMVSSPSGGICCEPDQLFIQCNTVALLAFSLHDRLHGTDYAASGHRLLRWAQQKIPVPGTQLFRDDYRMVHIFSRGDPGIPRTSPHDVPGLETVVRGGYPRNCHRSGRAGMALTERRPPRIRLGHALYFLRNSGCP